MLVSSNTGIYKITSPTGKVYIGQSRELLKRFRRYKSLETKKQIKIHLSLLKYGYDNHIVEIIHELPKDVTQEVLNSHEVLYMQLYRDCGVELLNLREGGHNGTLSEETRKKIGSYHIGKPVSPETRAKISKANKGQVPYMTGKKHSLETKNKMSKYATGSKRNLTEAGRLTLIESAKNARASIINPSHRKGTHHSNETKKLISQNRQRYQITNFRQVICSKTGHIFKTINDAAISIGMQPNTLRMQLRGANTNKTSFNYLS